jgi:hypothetical protein
VLLAKARSARNGEKFRALFEEGDLLAYGGDDSAADLALCNLLAFWSGGDRERMDRLFRRSALMRTKWDERRGSSTYGDLTIEKALVTRREPGDSTELGDPEASSRDLTMDREEALKRLWALPREAHPDTVMEIVQRFASSLDGAEPLEIQTAREIAMRALRKKVSAPGRILDAALAGVAPAPPNGPGGTYRPGTTSLYLSTADGLFHRKTTKDGPVLVPLTNFTATIVGEVVRDDGLETQRSFEVEAHHRGRAHEFEVDASQFARLGWVAQRLGATAIVNAGAGTRDHARAAIQYLSHGVTTRRVYTHLGFRKVDDHWHYLHAGGAIGPNGPVSGVEVEPPEGLRRYQLPEPPTGEELARAVRASLRCLRILPELVTIPLYSAIWRAPLGITDFSVHLVGQTGEGKTEAAALCQQHFGPRMNARSLPGSWMSTGNSLEILAFSAKDALLVVDDFAPGGTRFDVQRQHREAARLLRAKGNQSGRGRLRPDGTARPVKEPRALVLSTGEEVPAGHSIRARLFVLEVPAGGMAWELLTQCQADAAAGLHSEAMAGYVRWLATRYEEVQMRLPARVGELRQEAATFGGPHRRTPTIIADLAFGMELFLAYARDAGALDEREAGELWERTWTALGEAAGAQLEYLEATNPVSRFLELLGSALASGRAHAASCSGDAPDDPGLWGWRRDAAGGHWHPQGERVGWVNGEDLYLDPEAAFRSAEQMASVEGLTVTPRTLWKRMREQKLLASTDTSRGRNLARVTLQGARRNAIHVKTASLHPSTEPAQPAQAAREPVETGFDGPLLWADSGETGQKPAHGTGPGAAVEAPSPEVSGPIGTIGPVSDSQDEEWGEL